MEATIEIKGVEFTVIFKIDGETKQDYNDRIKRYGGLAQPFWEVNIIDVFHKGTSFFDFFEDNMKEIEDKVWYELT